MKNASLDLLLIIQLHLPLAPAQREDWLISPAPMAFPPIFTWRQGLPWWYDLQCPVFFTTEGNRACSPNIHNPEREEKIKPQGLNFAQCNKGASGQSLLLVGSLYFYFSWAVCNTIVWFLRTMTPQIRWLVTLVAEDSLLIYLFQNHLCFLASFFFSLPSWDCIILLDNEQKLYIYGPAFCRNQAMWAQLKPAKIFLYFLSFMVSLLI